MRQPWRDPPRAVSSPLPIQSTPSSSDEGDPGLMFAMSFSENHDESFSQNGYFDNPIHSSNILFNRAREQSARASMGSTRAGGTPCYNNNNTQKKRPQMVQPLYSFPAPSTTSNDSSTSPDSPISTRWPNHPSYKRNSGGSKRAPTSSSRRYGPINHSSTNDYPRSATEQLVYTSTDGDENEEEDNVEYSSDINEPHATSYNSTHQNYTFHISTFKNDADHHPSDDRPDRSQRGKSNGTRVRDEPCIAVVHGNNKFEAHIYPHPVQPVLSNAKHSRHRSTHDLFPSIPPLDIARSPFQNFSREVGGNLSGAPPTTTTMTTMNRPRSNTGGGGSRVSAPRHPLMSKNTATSYVSTSTLIPPGTLKADSQNMAVAFTSLKINDIDLGTSSSQKPRPPSRKL